MQIYISLLLAAITSTTLAAAPPEDDLLAGPDIEAEEVTSQDMTGRVLQEQGKSQKVGSRHQVRIWINVLKALDLSKDQEIEINKIMAEYQNKIQMFQDAHGKEIKSIRENANQKGKRDILTTIEIGAPKDQAAIPEESKKRLLELMQMMPDVTTYQAKAWAILTTDQQSVFQLEFQERIEEEQKRKAEKQLKDTPMGEMKEQDGFSPKGSKFRNRDIDPENDSLERSKDAVDKDTLRRIKFLRRLQELEQDKQ